MRKAGLYIHIPFCIQKCSYCDFFSLKVDKYYNALQGKEGSAFAKKLVNDIYSNAKKYGIEYWESVYIGGGTPSILSPDDIYFIFSHINKMQLMPPKECTIEINPEDITLSYLTAAEKSGVNRISLGIQSFSDNVLSSVKRRGSREKTLSALNLIRKNDSFILSCDLIAGLKNSTEAILKDDIETLLQFTPEHISLYSLCKNTSFTQKEEDSIALLWFYGKSLLEQQGYIRYEVSNFSYNGAYKSLHNQKYWKLEDYIGVGPSAVSSIFFNKTDNTPASALRFSVSKNISTWLKTENRNEIYEYENINENECIAEFIMMGLRLKEGIELLEFEKRFKKHLLNVIGKTIEKWTKNNMAILTQSSFYLTEKGSMFLNTFLKEAFNEIK